MAHNKSNKKVANGLVAMSSAAVLTVYAAGFIRTRPAANRVAYERFVEREAPQKAAREAEVPPAAANRPRIAPAQADRPEPKPAVVARAAASNPLHATAAMPVKNAPAPAAKTAAPVAAPAVAETASAASAAASAVQASSGAAVSTSADSQAEGAAATVAPAATASTAATAPTAPAAPVWKDGKYTAWGTCRHGDIQATVVIQAGKIVSADITDCETRYSCDVIDTLPPKVITRQKAKFDAIGGATESAYAYYGAVYWALDQASK